VLSFERHKWGGVRRDDLVYVRFDLDQFVAEPAVAPTTDDGQLFAALIDALRNAPPTMTASQAEVLLRSLKSNRAERQVMLDILGVCGILETASYRGYTDSFVDADRRELPPLRFVEHAYPVCWWKGSDGVNRAALAAFGLH
jgi:hypothetical protein